MLVEASSFELADVVDDSFAEAVDMDPWAVADSVAGAGYVDHVASSARCGDTVVRLLVGDDDDAVVWLADGVERGAEHGSAVRLRELHRVAQGKATARCDADAGVGEGEDADLLGDLAKEHGETVCGVGAQHRRTTRQRCDHASRDVNEQDGVSGKSHGSFTPASGLIRAAAFERAEHGALEHRLPLGNVTRRGEEAERKHTVGAHGLERGGDVVLTDSSNLHVAKVAQESKSAEASFDQEPLPVLPLVATTGECDLPGVGSAQLTRCETLPQLGLRGVAGTRVREEEYVAQLHGAIAVVLRERVLVEVW